MIWYPIWLVCVGLLWLGAASSDRNALRVMAVAAMLSHAMVVFVTANMPGYWKLVMPGAIEALTIVALLQWSPNRTGELQSRCLFVALLAHFLCYSDIATGLDLVYSRYETILLLVAIAQILCFHQTIARCAGLVVAWTYSIRVGGALGIPDATRSGVSLSDKVQESGKNPCGDRTK